jgi:hypothetical protein
VLRSVTDAYKEAGLEKTEVKGYNHDDDPIYGYPYSPDLFATSDITGAKVRHYLTLPDGRKAHPSELFPQIKQADINRAIGEVEAEERNRQGRNQSREARHAASKGDANNAYKATNRPMAHSFLAEGPDGRIVRIDGTDAEDAAYFDERGYRRVSDPVAADVYGHTDPRGNAREAVDLTGYPNLAAKHAAAPTPPDPHFTGTLTDSAGRTYQFVDGVRVGTDDPASLSENSLDSGDAPGNNAPVDAQPREEPTMPESNETPAAPTPEAAPAPAVNLDDYDHIEGTLKDTPRGRVLEAGEGGLGRQFGRAEIPGLKGHTFAHGGKLWKITAVGNKFERGRGSYRYLYVEPVGDHGPAPAPEPTPPAPAAVAAESGLAPLVPPPGGGYRGYLESVDATRPATLARLREQASLQAEQWPEKAADMARMAELLPTISDPTFWEEAGKRSAAMVLNILKRRPEWAAAP